ncbi:hypothetical protein RchiOBHm_Chr5g0046491 [Rosa chinensis]|uniref:Uncharacterized protein n=1 Tax=Rosa chinensis TaxID=74649 RepID=A0A2P6QE30_ROSCH|nr:hypothetical protein RchiOBHm_Chr5g0046491 [Rosa chinensis]
MTLLPSFSATEPSVSSFFYCHGILLSCWFLSSSLLPWFIKLSPSLSTTSKKYSNTCNHTCNNPTISMFLDFISESRTLGFSFDFDLCVFYVVSQQ